MTRIVHPVAAVIGSAAILLFWASKVTLELFGTQAQVLGVKGAIPRGLFVLVSALAVTGGTGVALSKRWRSPIVARKKRGMPVIPANDILVLVPCALALAWLAARQRFGPLFVSVQALEPAAGALTITLMSLSICDGLRLRRRPTVQRDLPAPFAEWNHDA